MTSILFPACGEQTVCDTRGLIFAQEGVEEAELGGLLT